MIEKAEFLKALRWAGPAVGFLFLYSLVTGSVSVLWFLLLVGAGLAVSWLGPKTVTYIKNKLNK